MKWIICKNMKILSVIVTYYPEEELLRKDFNAFVDCVDKVLMWENTPETEKLQYRFFYHEKIEYCGDGVNSISHALNYAWHYAQNNGYDYLLTMDQDSIWCDFSTFVKKVSTHSLYGNAIFCPHLNTEKRHNDDYSFLEYCITSGSFIPVSVLNKIGGYANGFDIDGIDLFLGLNAKERGINVICVNNSDFIQRFGNPNFVELFLWHVKINNYPANRLYGIMKSHIMVIRKFDVSSNLLFRIIKQYIIVLPLKILLFEKDKLRKFNSMISGIKDGFATEI